MSGSSPQARVQPAGPGAQRVRLVDDQQRARRPGQLAHPGEVALVREHDADVGQRGLHEDRGDVAVGEGRLQGREVVEGHHPGRQGHVHLRAERAGAGDHLVAVEHGQGLVDGAVVAPVHHRDLRPAGQVPGEAQHEPVGVGRRHRHLPAAAGRSAGASSPATQAASVLGSIVVMPVRARSWTASATSGSAWPVIAPVSPRHRSTYSRPSTSVNRAPEAVSKNDREGARPARHPRHRHPGEQVSRGPPRRARRSGGVLRRTVAPRPRWSGCQSVAVDHARASRLPRFDMPPRSLTR